jgi:hypothetical protein
MPVHVEQLRSAARVEELLIEAEVGDARELRVADASVDVVLVFGPLYRNDGMFRPRGTPYLMSPAAAPVC